MLIDSLGCVLQSIMAGLKQSDDESAQLTALTDLCEHLSISTEESLATFPVEQVVPLLVRRFCTRLQSPISSSRLALSMRVAMHAHMPSASGSCSYQSSCYIPILFQASLQQACKAAPNCADFTCSAGALLPCRFNCWVLSTTQTSCCWLPAP